MSTSNVVTYGDRIVTQTGEPSWDSPTVWFSESVEWLANGEGYPAQQARAALATNESNILAFVSNSATLLARIAADEAMFAATPVGSTLTAEQIAAFVRVEDELRQLVHLVIRHLMLTRIVPPSVV